MLRVCIVYAFCVFFMCVSAVFLSSCSFGGSGLPNFLGIKYGKEVNGKVTYRLENFGYVFSKRYQPFYTDTTCSNYRMTYSLKFRKEYGNRTYGAFLSHSPHSSSYEEMKNLIINKDFSNCLRGVQFHSMIRKDTVAQVVKEDVIVNKHGVEFLRLVTHHFYRAKDYGRALETYKKLDDGKMKDTMRKTLQNMDGRQFVFVSYLYRDDQSHIMISYPWGNPTYPNPGMQAFDENELKIYQTSIDNFKVFKDYAVMEEK